MFYTKIPAFYKDHLLCTYKIQNFEKKKFLISQYQQLTIESESSTVSLPQNCRLSLIILSLSKSTFTSWASFCVWNTNTDLNTWDWSGPLHLIPRSLISKDILKAQFWWPLLMIVDLALTNSLEPSCEIALSRNSRYWSFFAEINY